MDQLTLLFTKNNFSKPNLYLEELVLFFLAAKYVKYESKTKDTEECADQGTVNGDTTHCYYPKALGEKNTFDYLCLSLIM